MNLQATGLRQAVAHRMDLLKSELLKYGFTRTSDGKQLDQLNLTELEQIHINVKCQFGREMTTGE